MKYFVAFIVLISGAYFLFERQKVSPEIISPVKIPSSQGNSKSSSPFSIRNEVESIGAEQKQRVDEPPLSETVERLTASGSASDAFQAYQLVSQCIQAETLAKNSNVLALGKDSHPYDLEHKTRLEKQLATCANLTGSQRANRLKNLDKAIDAKIPGAALALLYEGPFGDASALETRPDDPNVIAWKKRTVEQLETYASNGDRGIFMALAQIYEAGVLTPRNLELASTYVVALSEIDRLEGKENSRRNSERWITTLQKDLTAQKIESIRVTGKKLAENCCSRKK